MFVVVSCSALMKFVSLSLGPEHDHFDFLDLWSRVIIWEVVDSAFWLQVGRSCTRIPSESFGPPFLLSPDRLLPGAGSAMSPVGRLGPHRQPSSTSRICPWGCCSNCLTNTAGAAVPGPVNMGIITTVSVVCGPVGPPGHHQLSSPAWPSFVFVLRWPCVHYRSLKSKYPSYLPQHTILCAW